MRNARRLLAGPEIRLFAILVSLVLLALPMVAVAGDADSVAGYKFKIYEETPPGDGPSSYSTQGAGGSAQANGAQSIVVPNSNLHDSSSRFLVLLSELWGRLRLLAPIR